MLPNYSKAWDSYPHTDFQNLVIYRGYLKTNTEPVIFDEVDKYRNILLSFTGKQEYLDWVTHWKSEYKVLTEKQKGLKKYIRQPHITTKIKDNGYWIVDNPFAVAQSKASLIRDMLSSMLYLRIEGKKKSWKMKRESQ